MAISHPWSFVRSSGLVVVGIERNNVHDVTLRYGVANNVLESVSEEEQPDEAQMSYLAFSAILILINKCSL